MRTYEIEVGYKTKFLNFFRRIFKLPFLETYIAKKTQNQFNGTWVRFSPPHYLYKKNSNREVIRHGIKYALDISDGPEHAVYFGYKEVAQEELYRIAEGAEVIVDVGANLGAVSLNLAKVCPNAKIYSFEPDTSNYRKAERNFALNDVKNITLIRAGVGERSSTERLFDVNPLNAGMKRIILTPLKDPFTEQFAFEEIHVVTLDEFALENNVENIGLIKIDVEGFELKVLKGAAKLLRSERPTLFIELDDDYLREHGDSGTSLIRYLLRLGYRVRRADDNTYIDDRIDTDKCHFDIICESDHRAQDV